jgi:putative transcriptional regulator
VTSNENDQAQENPLDSLLAGYARGRLNPPLHVLVASHLEIQPASRGFVRAMEELSAAELLRSKPIELHDRDARLAAIFERGEALDSGPRRVDEPGVSPAPGGRILPRPLARYLGHGLDEVPWRRLLPGVREYRIEDNENGEATLYWIKGGRKMPSHTHEGSEFTLVLQGAFSDVNGRYERGDIAIADTEVDHRPVADPGEDCICFAVTDAPLQLTGPIGRIVQRLFKKH